MEDGEWRIGLLTAGRSAQTMARSSAAESLKVSSLSPLSLSLSLSTIATRKDPFFEMEEVE